MTHQQIAAALQVLRPGAEWSLSGDDYANLIWLDGVQTKPTADEVTAAIAVLPPAPVYLPSALMLSRLTANEYVAIMQAAAAQLAGGNGQLALWLDMARTATNGVNLNDPVTAAAKAGLIVGNLLTQDRANAIFAA